MMPTGDALERQGNTKTTRKKKPKSKLSHSGLLAVLVEFVFVDDQGVQHGFDEID